MFYDIAGLSTEVSRASPPLAPPTPVSATYQLPSPQTGRDSTPGTTTTASLEKPMLLLQSQVRSSPLHRPSSYSDSGCTPVSSFEHHVNITLTKRVWKISIQITVQNMRARLFMLCRLEQMSWQLLFQRVKVYNDACILGWQKGINLVVVGCVKLARTTKVQPTNVRLRLACISFWVCFVHCYVSRLC